MEAGRVPVRLLDMKYRLTTDGVQSQVTPYHEQGLVLVNQPVFTVQVGPPVEV